MGIKVGFAGQRLILADDMPLLGHGRDRVDDLPAFRIGFDGFGGCLRGKGVGSSLLQAAEDAARDYGAKRVFLNTFRFQAPDFYLKHGYREVFRLDEFPYTGTKYYFTKDLV